MDLGPARVTTRASAPRRRSIRRILRWAAVGAIGLSLASPQVAAAQESTGPAFEIVVDQDRALFELSGLVPGPVGQRCLTVEVRNGAATSVAVSAQVAGALGTYLTLTVESGDATDPATCAGFSGTTRFSGTVAELGALHSDPSTGLIVPLTDERRTVLRFTLSLADDNAAQGERVELSLGFDATDVTPPPTTVTPTTATPTTVTPTTATPTTAPPTTVPTTLAPSSSLGAPAVPVSSIPVTTTTVPDSRPPRTTAAGQAAPATTTGSSPSTPDVVVVDGGQAASPSLGDRAAEVVEAGVEAAVAAAGVTARTSVVPGAFSGIALAFFLLQSRFERSDPKLADAPLEPEDDLVFEPRAEVAV